MTQLFYNMVLPPLFWLALLGLMFFLAGKKSRWPGLALLIVGAFLAVRVFLLEALRGNLWYMLEQRPLFYLSIFFMRCLPALLLLFLYLGRRRHIKKNTPVQKTQIQDLK